MILDAEKFVTVIELKIYKLKVLRWLFGSLEKLKF